MTATQSRVPTEKVASPRNLFSTIAELAIPVSLVLLVVYFASRTDTFLTIENAQNITRQSAVIAIAAVGLTVVLVGGGIDISQGAVMVMAGLTVIHLVGAGVPEVIALLCALLAGVGIGFLNGFFSEWLGIPALMATLGVGLMFRGIAFVWTEGRSVSVESGQGEILRWLGRGEVLGVPAPFAVAAVLALLTAVWLRRTIWGRHLYAVGGNADAARAAGIPVDRVRWATYVFGAATSALAGIVLAGRLGSAAPGAQATAEFEVITAVVLGGVSIFGGVGRVGRVIIAALFLATLTNGLVQLNVPPFWERVVTGGVFLAALSIDRLGRRKGPS